MSVCYFSVISNELVHCTCLTLDARLVNFILVLAEATNLTLRGVSYNDFVTNRTSFAVANRIMLRDVLTVVNDDTTNTRCTRSRCYSSLILILSGFANCAAFINRNIFCSNRTEFAIINGVMLCVVLSVVINVSTEITLCTRDCRRR